MTNVLKLPLKPKPPPLNWDRIDALRREHFPKISKKVLKILKMIYDSKFSLNQDTKPDCYVVIDCRDDHYPPKPIRIAPREADMLWILDLLDRYGGKLKHGEHHCNVRRSNKKPALFILQPVSAETIEALHISLGQFYEHFIEDKSWRLMAKELAEVDLMIFVIEKGEKMFLGMIDKGTAYIVFKRFDGGMPLKELFLMAEECK